MSYDVYFLPKTGDTLPTRDEFIGFFRNQTHYQCDGRSEFFAEGTVLYENPDTGVHFSVGYLTAEETEALLEGLDIKDEDRGASAHLEINVNRPKPFALEADIEIKKIVDHFDLLVQDPKHDGRLAKPYASEEFISEWNSLNKSACRIATSEKRHGRPSQELLAIWKWNYQRHELQAELGDNIFVPKISWVTIGSKLSSTVVWNQGIPILLPKVDAIYFSTRIGWWRKRFSNEFGFLSWEQILPLLAEYKTKQEPIPHWILNWTKTPKKVAQLGDRTASTETATIVHPANVFDGELLSGEPLVLKRSVT